MKYIACNLKETDSQMYWNTELLLQSGALVSLRILDVVQKNKNWKRGIITPAAVRGSKVVEKAEHGLQKVLHSLSS